MSQLAGLSLIDRQTIVFIKAYENVRKTRGQEGYRTYIFNGSDDPTQAPAFKTFRTVTEWMIGKGWNVSWSEFHWQGFIEYVFKSLSPIIPQPGQLKNPVLLKKYISSAPNVEAKALAQDEMEILYRKVLRPEIINNPYVMKMLGLKNGTMRGSQ